jgi:IclR family transcriptional regulator, pca regulon regulatory protein
MNGNNQYYVEALGRGLAILGCFVDGPSHLSLAELCERVNLNRGTTFRLLRTLEHAGYVSQDPSSKKYQLTLKVLDLQRAALRGLDVATHARPLMEQINERFEESVSVAILEGTSIRYIARVPSRRIMSINLDVGSKLPAHATSLGKVLLAGLTEAEISSLYEGIELKWFTDKTIVTFESLIMAVYQTGRLGFAINDEELEVGLRSVSAPIHDHTGRVIAAMNVSVSSARMSVEFLETHVAPILVEATMEVSTYLGYRTQIDELAASTG